jgi:hypothetical protein
LIYACIRRSGAVTLDTSRQLDHPGNILEVHSASPGLDFLASAAWYRRKKRKVPCDFPTLPVFSRNVPLEGDGVIGYFKEAINRKGRLLIALDATDKFSAAGVFSANRFPGGFVLYGMGFWLALRPAAGILRGRRSGSECAVLGSIEGRGVPHSPPPARRTR